MTDGSKIRVGIIGASGYTGADLIRLAAVHPQIKITALTANAHAGQSLGAVYPHLSALGLPDLVKTDDVDWSQTDAVFCGLPHGTSQEVISALPSHLKVIDLSADFRLRNTKTYAEWYGHSHRAPDLQSKAVYGLTEYYRDDIAKADLVACPGCYPTAALLGLLPLLSSGVIDPTDIVIDAKSGVTGAGRSVKQANLFSEVAEGIHPYGIAAHRHAPEIEQEVSKIAGQDVLVNFTPHLMPMNRGELLTMYLRGAGKNAEAEARKALVERYRDEPFVHIVGDGDVPATRHVRGTNYCRVNVFADRIPGRIIVVSTLDNLVKGSSGQALQNFNLMFGLTETLGLEQQALFP